MESIKNGAIQKQHCYDGYYSWLLQMKIKEFNQKMRSTYRNDRYSHYEDLWPHIDDLGNVPFERNITNMFAQVRNAYSSGMNAAAFFFLYQKELIEIRRSIDSFNKFTKLFHLCTDFIDSASKEAMPESIRGLSKFINMNRELMRKSLSLMKNLIESGEKYRRGEISKEEMDAVLAANEEWTAKIDEFTDEVAKRLGFSLDDED